MALPGGYLLDTNVIIALVRNNNLGRFIDRTHSLSSGSVAVYAPVVALGEVYSLALQWGWEASRRARLGEVLSAFFPIEIRADDLLAAYAGLDHGSHAIGIKMGKNDLWIAAMAQHYGLTVLTTDRDFDHLIAAKLIDGIWIDPDSN